MEVIQILEKSGFESHKSFFLMISTDSQIEFFIWLHKL
jgi:hypothetical protein